MVRLKEFEKTNGISANIYAKTEFANPFGSIKDRVALRIIEKAEATKHISENCHIVEATSGNMGIALAGISQIKCYNCSIVMPENMSDKRKYLIKKYGAELILTPDKFGMQGAINKTKEIIPNSKNIYYTDQFNNYASIEAHKYSTAPEIYKQLNGKVDIIIAGIGTGATISGIGEYYKTINPTTKIIGILPSNYPHKIQGIGAGFAPPLLNHRIIDKIITVEDNESFYEKTKIYETEGLGVGISSGAVIAGLKKFILSNNCFNKNIVLIFADGSDRYE